MQSAQQHLDGNFPNKEERWKVRVVNLTNRNLTGDLDVSDFSWRTQVIIIGNPNLGAIIDSKFLKTKIIGTRNVQEWLDRWYPINETCLIKSSYFGKRKEEIKKLDIVSQNLTGSLELVGFWNLTNLDCSHNQLTSLDVSHCPKLTWLSCSDNPQLDYILLPIQQLTNLKKFNCENTKFAEELAFYGYNYLAWAEAHPQLLSEHGLAPVINSYYNTKNYCPLLKKKRHLFSFCFDHLYSLFYKKK